MVFWLGYPSDSFVQLSAEPRSVSAGTPQDTNPTAIKRCPKKPSLNHFMTGALRMLAVG